MVKIPDFAQVGLQPGGMQAYNDAAIRPLDVDAGREAQQMGRAIEQVGRGLGDYASALLTQARMEQNDLNRSYAVEAFVDYRSKVDKDLYDPQTGYFNKGGKAAFEGERDAVFGRMQQYLDDVEKALPNQAAKDLFRNRALLFAEERGLQVDLHAGKERKVYQNAVDEQLLQAEQADVPMLWKDADTQTYVRPPDAPKTEFQMRLEAFQKSIRDVGARRGSAPEVIEANVEAATTAVYAQVVDREADPAKALKLFDQFVADKKIVTQDPQKARTMLQNKVSANVGQETAAQLWDQFNGDYDLAANALNEKRRAGELDVEAFNKGDAQLGLLQRQKATAFASRGLSALQAARKWMDDPANSKAELGDMPADMLTALRDTDTLDAAMTYRANGRMFLNKAATLDAFAKMAASGELGNLPPEQLELMFRSGANDAMWAHIQNVWSQQSGYGAQPQGGGTGSRQGSAGNVVPEPIQAMLLSRLQEGGQISLNDAAKPSNAASQLRYALYQAEFARRWQQHGTVTDPQATALDIHQSMMRELDTVSKKFAWEVLPDQREAMRFSAVVPGTTKTIAVDASSITPPETASAVTALATQGIPVSRQTPSMVQQQVVQQRANTESERARQRAQTNNRWVSWETVRTTLGMDPQAVVTLAVRDSTNSPVHPSDLIYPVNRRVGWRESLSSAAFGIAPDNVIRGYTADRYAKFGEGEFADRDMQHVGISRAAYDRLVQHQATLPSAATNVPTAMTYGSAREYSITMQRLSNAQLPRSAEMEQRAAQAALAYELEWPELAFLRSRGGRPIVRTSDSPPPDIVSEYNMLRSAANAGNAQPVVYRSGV